MIKTVVWRDDMRNNKSHIVLAAEVCIDGAYVMFCLRQQHCSSNDQKVNGLTLRTRWESLGRGIVR